LIFLSTQHTPKMSIILLLGLNSSTKLSEEDINKANECLHVGKSVILNISINPYTTKIVGELAKKYKVPIMYRLAINNVSKL